MLKWDKFNLILTSLSDTGGRITLKINFPVKISPDFFQGKSLKILRSINFIKKKEMVFRVPKFPFSSSLSRPNSYLKKYQKRKENVPANLLDV